MDDERSTGTLSVAGRERLSAGEGEPVFFNDWMRSLFIHFEVDPDVLQALVPFPLDLRGGRAYVSLVAFTMERLRFRGGGVLGRLAAAPVARHGFLNVRTYVMHEGEAGIYFIAEWLSNRLSVLLGPRMYGLPYRLGRLSYAHEHERGRMVGRVTAPGIGLGYEARVAPGAEYRPSAEGSLSEFLLERYTAFTQRRGVRRRFRVWHEPWAQASAEVELEDDGLLAASGPWCAGARIVGVNYAPGARDVWVGRPVRV